MLGCQLNIPCIKTYLFPVGTFVSGKNNNIVDIFGFVVKILNEANFSIAGSDFEGVDVVLERVVDDRVAPAVHVLCFQLKNTIIFQEVFISFL